MPAGNSRVSVKKKLAPIIEGVDESENVPFIDGIRQARSPATMKRTGRAVRRGTGLGGFLCRYQVTACYEI